MSLSSLNTTQRLEALNVLSEFTASSIAPLLLVESFIIGALCVCVPLGLYMLWIKLHPTRAPLMLSALALFTALTTHWALSLRQLEGIINGRALRVTLGNADYGRLEGTNSHAFNSYVGFGHSWQFVLPLVNETLLFGFASSLFAVVVGITLPRYRSQRKTGLAIIIPSLATTMYTMSLMHWAISLRYYVGLEKGAAAGVAFDPLGLRLALGILLSLNIILSDFIVMWRVCIVWERSRPVTAFCAALAITIVGLNFANLGQRVINIPGSLRLNGHDSEIIATYGGTSVSLAAAFVSLASNISSTMLVGMKAWLHRRQLAEHMSTANRRTLAARVMELLVESGVVYAVIWILYSVSFFRVITSYTVDFLDNTHISAATYLDAAMAQITAIYPLMIFILVAFDKIHRTRGPGILGKPEGPANRREGAVTITFEVDVERGGTLSPGTAHPIVALHHPDDGCKAAKDHMEICDR